MTKKILIIGSRGYIGSSLYYFLKLQGYDVSGTGSKYDDYNRLSNDYIQQFEYIILLAGNSSVASCMGELKSPWNNNVRNFQNLIEKCSTDQKIIYASSSSVYGKNNLKLYTENDLQLDYLNNYDLTKISLDLLAQRYQSVGGNIIGLRFGTVNGGGCIVRRDLMINSMVYDALNANRISVANPNIHRPILALKDLNYAIKSIISGNWVSGIYNLASFNSTVLTIAQTVSDTTGIQIENKGNYGNPYDFRIDCTKFCSIYNYTFRQTVNDIVNDLVYCYTRQQPIIVNRNSYVDYQG